MADDRSHLPPSLAVVPNIPFQHQTIEQLIAERAYWEGKIRAATGWGAALGLSGEFRDACDKELERRAALNDGGEK